MPSVEVKLKRTAHSFFIGSIPSGDSNKRQSLPTLMAPEIRPVRPLLLTAALLLSLASSVFSQVPNTPAFYIEQGTSLWHHGKYDEAISSYTRAIEIDEGTVKSRTADKFVYDRLAKAYLLRAKVRSILRILDGAFADMDRALELHPRWAEAYYWRGIIYKGSGNAKQAIVEYSRAIDIDPGYAQAYKDRGYARGDIGDLDEALNDYDASLKIDPNDLQTYFFRGSALINRRDYTGAIADASRMIEMAPDHHLGYKLRGIVFLILGRDAEAEPDFTKYRQLTPEDESVLKDLIDRIKARRKQQ